MTASDRFERQLPELFEDLASARIPDYFDDMLQATARTRQRPAWLSFERWLPMDTALPAAAGRSRTFAWLGALALVGLLIAAALLAYAGSRPHRVPAPFGPAGNGSIYSVAANGDLFTVDPTTDAMKTILTGAKADAVLPSLDGLQIAFAGKVLGGEGLSVANQDGSNSHALPGAWTNVSELAWSPKSDEVAIVSEVAGVSSLSILPADGSPSKTLPLGLEVHNFWSQPDGTFVFAGTKGTGGARTYGLYVVNADGSGLRAIEPPTAAEADWQALNASQDGRSLVYYRWRDPGEKGRLHVVDIASGKDTQVQVTGTVDGEAHEGALFSPDGMSLLFKRYAPDGSMRLAVVPVAGGAAVSIGPAVPNDQSPNAGYSPDGKTVIAWYPSTKELWLLDPTGGTAGGDRKLDLAVTDTPTWQRVAP